MRSHGRSAGVPRTLHLGARVIPYQLLRSARRRTIGLRIDGVGLRVSAPPWTAEVEIEEVLQQHARWILDKLERWQPEGEPHGPGDLEDGRLLLWLGREVPLQRVPAIEAIPRPVSPEEQLAAIPIARECEDPHTAVTAWYMAQAMPWFRRRATFFAERLGVAPREIRLTSARGRWGSCTGKGVIRLNWRLMQASPAEIDYVVAHEMAHLVELHHGAAFWDTVARIYPEWSAASDLLDSRDRIYRRL